MPYTVRVEKFEGPLDLLLQLIEGEKLEITEISLVQVTEPFVQHVRERQGTIPPEELADFLVVAAKLIYLKSRALLPELTDQALDEGPDLADQLRMYKAFVEASHRLGEMDRRALRSYLPCRQAGSGPRRFKLEAGFWPPSGLTAAMLAEEYGRVVRWLQPLAQLARASIARAVTLEDKIQELAERLRGAVKNFTFHSFMRGAKSRDEAVVSFLALLELIKQRLVKATQGELFEDINLSPN